MGLKALHGAVGPHKPNQQEDVKFVQELLNNHSYATHITLTVDGDFGPKTAAAISAFQRKVVAMLHPDGIVDVNGVTLRKLESSSIPATLGPSAATPPASGAGPTRVLSDADFAAAAKTLNCEVAAIRAVAKVETGVCGVFDSQNRPVILYERHVFSRLTDGAYDKSHPDISSPTPYGQVKGGYGKCSEQYPKLERAEKLDKEAALESASWGAFQIMGENYQTAGYTSVEAMVQDMGVSIQKHLNAFLKFILANQDALKGIQTKNWAQFARAYNGPAYAENNYDTNIAAAYKAFGGK